MPVDRHRPPPLAPLALVGAVAGGWLSATLAHHDDGAGTSGARRQASARRALAALTDPHARATVERTIDGDTAVVRFRDDRGPARVTVRYLGVDTPESVDPDEPVQCFGPEASRANHRWVTGRRVRLLLDRERIDPYGRVLAALRPDGWRRTVSERLVAEGYARVLTIPPNGESAPRLLRLAANARIAGRGLWTACGDALPSRQ